MSHKGKDLHARNTTEITCQKQTAQTENKSRQMNNIIFVQQAPSYKYPE
jgi:hypothetical protein